MRKPLEFEAPRKQKRSSAAAVMITMTTMPKPASGGDDNDDTTEAEPRSSAELPPLLRANLGTIDPAMFPLPVSRPASRLTTNVGSGAQRRRPPYYDDEEEDDDHEEEEEESEGGAEADGEYIPNGNTRWNVDEGRRRVKVKAGVNASGEKKSSNRGLGRDDEVRRHSIAV